MKSIRHTLENKPQREGVLDTAPRTGDAIPRAPDTEQVRSNNIQITESDSQRSSEIQVKALPSDEHNHSITTDSFAKQTNDTNKPSFAKLNVTGAELIIPSKNTPQNGESNIQGQEDFSRKQSDSDNEMQSSLEMFPPLTSFLNGIQKRVKLFVNGKEFVPENDRMNKSNPHGIGYDGNQFYCHVCGDFGEIVCCDGCPRAYHLHCIPKDHPSRLSLENDEDPWYCPDCTTEGHLEAGEDLSEEREDSVENGGRRSSHARCVDCRMKRSDLSLEPCYECGNYVHHPHCQGDEDPSSRVYCATCQAVNAQTTEEDLAFEQEMAEEDFHGDGERRPDSSNSQTKRRGKRRRTDSVSEKAPRHSQMKKPKKRSSSLDINEHVMAEPLESSMQGPNISVSGIPQATPAFVFFLGENRWKIERSLSRKHRYFNRLPKGTERNELVAKEGALWWTKLRSQDYQRYINMSIRDLETRIIQWKEDKNLKDMTMSGEFVGSSLNADDTENPLDDDDSRLTMEKHKRLFLGTSVGCKVFTREPDQSYNRVLMDLLHDTRFHPIPMLSAERPEKDFIKENHGSKMTIPYFDVIGPVSTSLGDECLGCSRGWTHHCPVLQRKIPAVEHRAKLQPPLSSLLATRIGLGLRPFLERTVDVSEINEEEQLEPLMPRSLAEFREIQRLPSIPTCTLTHPSNRADDIVEFIEEVVAMKIPEPTRPENQEKMKKVGMNRSLRLHRTREESDVGSDTQASSEFNKCGRCRTIIQGDLGCVQCRRAQLVINMSKMQHSTSNDHSKSKPSDSKMLKVHTAMMPRVQLKEKDMVDEVLSPGDEVISNAILKRRWAPFLILPPKKLFTPSLSKRSREDQNVKCSNSSADSYSESEIDSDNIANSDDQCKEAKNMGLTSFECSISVSEDAAKRKGILQSKQKSIDLITRRAITIACSGILLALVRRDPLRLFAETVSEEGIESIHMSIDLDTIRSRVLGAQYTSLAEFVADVQLLCDNARQSHRYGSIHSKTALDLNKVISKMQERANTWINALVDSYVSTQLRSLTFKQVSHTRLGYIEEFEKAEESFDDCFDDLRTEWPEAAKMFENEYWLRKQLETDFMRTKENEAAYYGSIATRRVAAAAEASLAPYPDSSELYSVVPRRSHIDDDALRNNIDERVSRIKGPIELGQVSTWREESIVRLLRKVQHRRVDCRVVSDHGCARCDELEVDQERKKALTADSLVVGKYRKKDDIDSSRVDSSRMGLTTGLASAKTREKIDSLTDLSPEDRLNNIHSLCVSVRGSKIHGLGLFADQPFKKGDVVAEYIGEYITDSEIDARLKNYQEQRIQDYIFRFDVKSAIDATKKGGWARYANHHCTPNCFTKVIGADGPQSHLKRVLITALRDISINEELTYDYQFPLELDLNARIPCNCGSDHCRGFMNWDFPEKGSTAWAILVQKRGANMRDRIRRLGKPLKRDEM